MLPDLDRAQPTLQNLHTVARLLGAVRLLVFERRPNFLELGLKVKPDGISTELLPAGGEVTLDFRQLALVYQPTSGNASSLPIAGKTQAALFEALLATIYANELSSIAEHRAGEPYVESIFRAADGFVNRIKLSRDHLSDTTPLAFDAVAATDYANALDAIFTGVARFRARLEGTMTPAVVWPEHFDLSFLWFAAEPDEHHPHLNFGFAPFSAGIDFPYLYAYAYPYPAQYAPPKLPAGARWHTEGWTGVVLPYAEIARQANSVLYVEESCEAIYRSLRQLLG